MMRLLMNIVMGIMAFAVALPSAAAINQNSGNLLLRIQVSDALLLPFESLCIRVILENTSESVEAEVPGDWPRYLHYWYREKGTDDWRRIEIWWLPQVSRPPLPPEILGTGNHLVHCECVYTFDSQIEPLLKQDREYEFRATLRSSQPVVHLASDSKVIAVKEFPESERAPVARLVQGNGFDRMIFELSPAVDLSQKPIWTRLNEIEKFVDAFPDSFYSLQLRRTYLRKCVRSMFNLFSVGAASG